MNLPVRFVEHDDLASLENAKTLLGRIRNDADLFSQMAEALHFPKWFGENWDALFDLLSDPEWLREEHGQRITLLVPDALLLWKEAPRTAGRLTEIWLAAAESMRDEGIELELRFLW